MTKQQFIKKCTKLNLLVIANGLCDSTELIDMSGKSDYRKVFNDDWGLIGWDARYKEVAFNLEQARKQQSK